MAQADSIPSAVRVLITGAGPKPSTNSVRADYVEFLGHLAGHPPQSIPFDPRAFDLKERSEHLALSAYLIADIKQNVPVGLDLIDALLSDLASEVIGTLQNAVPRMARRVA
jgi:hypothetical protein